MADPKLVAVEECGFEDLRHPLIEPNRDRGFALWIDEVGQVGMEGLVVEPLHEPLRRLAKGSLEGSLIGSFGLEDLLAFLLDSSQKVARNLFVELTQVGLPLVQFIKQALVELAGA